jgi:hypothetical protein
MLLYMLHARSKISMVWYSKQGYLLDHQAFETKWCLQSQCNSQDTAFFGSLLDTLTDTTFPLNNDMQDTLRSALTGMRDQRGLLKMQTPLYTTVQLTPELACAVDEHCRRVVGKTCLEVCNGSLLVAYKTETEGTADMGKKRAEIKTSLPTQCISWTAADGSALLINSWTYPTHNVDNSMHSSSIHLSKALKAAIPGFSQHFLVTDGTTFHSKAGRHVVQLGTNSEQNKTINRNIIKLRYKPTAQSHRDTRTLSKSEHTAIRHACGFSDNAWQHAVLTANTHFSVWSTAHIGNNVFVVSLFLH